MDSIVSNIRGPPVFFFLTDNYHCFGLGFNNAEIQTKYYGKIQLNAIMLPSSYLCGRKKTWVTLADVELASVIIVQKLGRFNLLRFFFKMRHKGIKDTFIILCNFPYLVSTLKQSVT